MARYSGTLQRFGKCPVSSGKEIESFYALVVECDSAGVLT